MYTKVKKIDFYLNTEKEREMIFESMKALILISLTIFVPTLSKIILRLKDEFQNFKNRKKILSNKEQKLFIILQEIRYYTERIDLLLKEENENMLLTKEIQKIQKSIEVFCKSDNIDNLKTEFQESLFQESLNNINQNIRNTNQIKQKLNLSMQEKKSLLSDLYISKMIAQYNYILAFIPKKTRENIIANLKSFLPKDIEKYDEILDNNLYFFYILWNGVNRATKNPTLKSYGTAYEIYCGMFIAKKLNPKNITFNGISKGKKDEGIDLIVYNSNGTISLVQCKFRKEDLITENDIIKFIKDTQMYQFNHKRHAYCIEKLYFITSSNFTEEAKQIAVDKNINLIAQSPWIYK